jgi:hypothetical protein
MRALTRKERQLSMAFGVIALLVFNLFVMRWISAEIQSMRGQVNALDLETQSLLSLALERPYWETRAAWLAANQPMTYEGQTTDSEFAERVQREIRQFDLSIESQQLLGAENVGTWVATPMDLTVRGDLKSIVRWLQSAQGPGKFMAVQSFNLRQSDDGAGMILRIRLRQLFLGENGEDDSA